METLTLKEVVSKKHDLIYLESPREMAPVYTIGDSHRRWIDRRFKNKHIVFNVDDPSLIKEEGEMYDAVYAGGYIFGNAKVLMVVKEEIKDTYLVVIDAERVAFAGIAFSLDEKGKMSHQDVRLEHRPKKNREEE